MTTNNVSLRERERWDNMTTNNVSLRGSDGTIMTTNNVSLR